MRSRKLRFFGKKRDLAQRKMALAMDLVQFVDDYNP